MSDNLNAKLSRLRANRDITAEQYKTLKSALEKQVAKPITNADRIRAMSDGELADFLDNVFNNIFDEYEFPCEFCTEKINCDVCFAEWLKKEVEDEV